MGVEVFVVDDHEVVRRGLRVLLASEDDMTVIGEAGSVAETLSRLATLAPDVVVLDVRLPDGTGIELCSEIRATWPSIGCLVLTSHDDDDVLFEAMVAGASGFLLKRVGGDEIVDAIRVVGQGRSVMDPATTQRVVDRLRTRAMIAARLAALSDQERRILDLLAEGRSNRQIAAELFLAEATVKNYVSRVLIKMGMSTRAEAAVFAARHAERQHAGI